MMNPITPELTTVVYATQLQVLLIANGLIVAAGAIAIYRLWRLASRYEAFRNSPAGAPPAEQPDSDAVLCGFLDHRLRLMKEDIQRSLGEQRPVKAAELPQPPPKTAAMPFEYAVRLARQGAGIDDLVQACGLSRAEARLVHRVHGSARADVEVPPAGERAALG